MNIYEIYDHVAILQVGKSDVIKETSNKIFKNKLSFCIDLVDFQIMITLMRVTWVKDFRINPELGRL